MAGPMRQAAMAAALILAMAGPALAEKVSISGDVTYAEKVKLPADATLEIALVDLAVPGVPRVAASAAINERGKVPLTFTLGFDSKVIAKGHSYGLTARIVSAGDVWFRTGYPVPVDPLNAAGPVEIVAGFVGTIQSATPASPAASDTVMDDIIGVTWRAETLDGNPVIAQGHPTISIGGDMRAGGRGGCNSWFSEVTLGDATLAFSAVAATRMACPSADETAEEKAFFDALAATRFWRLDGERLILSDADGTQLATFSRSRF